MIFVLKLDYYLKNLWVISDTQEGCMRKIGFGEFIVKSYDYWTGAATGVNKISMISDDIWYQK